MSGVWDWSEVHVVKDSQRKVWDVFTPKHPRQLLVTIPWADAFKGIEHKHAPDYVNALDACRSNDTTDLTMEEEAEVLAVLHGAKLQAAQVADARPDTKPNPPSPPKTNVLSLDAFRKRKK